MHKRYLLEQKHPKMPPYRERIWCYTYSSVGDFVVGLCVALIVPIVYAALLSWRLAPVEMNQMV